ncbi:hypothetical protein A9Q83_13530 [Alphaproteobacteria bacterium 46_93_T64]|mgnify:CR=1 FL=1|nr:hypothetical protein A9Q83_13530 [Alphaproteobacteria bacterium 46_93_T64]
MSKFDLLKSANVELSLVSFDGAKFIQQGADLVIQPEDSSETITLANFSVATASELPVQMTLVDGSVVSLAQLQEVIDAASIENIAPAAGGGTGGGSGGGAAFTDAPSEEIGTGLSTEGLQEDTTLVLPENTEVREEQEELVADTIETDPCNDLFDTKVTAFREAFRDQPEYDNPNGFKYYHEGEIVDGDGNNSGVLSHNHDYGSASEYNDKMNESNLSNGTEVIVGDIHQDDMYGAQDFMYGPRDLMYGENYARSLDVSTDFDGNDQGVSIFNDDITATSTTSLLVGDMFTEVENARESDTDIEASFEEVYSAGADVGSNNTIEAFNDSLVGGENTKAMVGDILVTADGSGEEMYPWSDVEASISITISLSAEGHDISSNSYTMNNDILDGSASDNTQLLVGDMAAIGNTRLRVSTSMEFSLTAQSADSSIAANKFSALGDLLIGGSGNDMMSGDAFMVDLSGVDTMQGGYGSDIHLESDINLSANGDEIWVDGGNNDGIYVVEDGGVIEDNQFSFNNDVMDGGAGNDIMAGDVIAINAGSEYGTMNIDLSVDVDYDARGYHGSYNSSEEIEADVTALGGSIQNNSFSAHNDILRGDDGSDESGNAGDFLVGDVLVTGNSDVDLEFDITVNTDTGYEDSLAGTISGNTVDAWNDTLIGGAGGDTLVGDAAFEVYNGADAYLTVDANIYNSGESEVGTDGTTINAFNDLLCAGDGDDVLVGDFLGEYTVGEGSFDGPPMMMVSDSSQNEFGLEDDSGNAVGTFFEDTLRGDAGNDTLIGQLGDDTLNGGEGADTFVYEGSESWEVNWNKESDGDDYINVNVENNTITRSEGNDTIQDFNHEEGDTIDLDGLFDSLGINGSDNRAYQVNIEDNVLTIEGIEDFSITVQGDALPNVVGSTNMTSDDLAEIGIIVGAGDVS